MKGKTSQVNRRYVHFTKRAPFVIQPSQPYIRKGREDNIVRDTDRVDLYERRGETSLYVVTSTETSSQDVAWTYRRNSRRKAFAEGPTDRITRIVTLKSVAATRFLLISDRGRILYSRDDVSEAYTEFNGWPQVSNAGAGAVFWDTFEKKNSYVFYPIDVDKRSEIAVCRVDAQYGAIKMYQWRSPGNQQVNSITSIVHANTKKIVFAVFNLLFVVPFQDALTENPQFTNLTPLVVRDMYDMDDQSCMPSVVISNQRFLVWITFDKVYIIPLVQTFPTPSLILDMGKIMIAMGLTRQRAKFVTEHRYRPVMTDKHLIFCSESQLIAISLLTGKIGFHHSFGDKVKVLSISNSECEGAFYMTTSSGFMDAVYRQGDSDEPDPSSVETLRMMENRFVQEASSSKFPIDHLTRNSRCNVNRLLLSLLQQKSYDVAVKLLESVARKRNDTKVKAIFQCLITELQVMKLVDDTEKFAPKYIATKQTEVDILKNTMYLLRLRSFSPTINLVDINTLVDVVAPLVSDNREQNGKTYIRTLLTLGKIKEAVNFIVSVPDRYQEMLPGIAVFNPPEFIKSVMELDETLQTRILKIVIPYVRGHIGCLNIMSILKRSLRRDWSMVSEIIWALCFERDVFGYRNDVSDLIESDPPKLGDELWTLVDLLDRRGLRKISKALLGRDAEQPLIPHENSSMCDLSLTIDGMIDDMSSILNQIKDLTKKSRDYEILLQDLIKEGEAAEAHKSDQLDDEKQIYCSYCQMRLYPREEYYEMMCGHNFHVDCMPETYDFKAELEYIYTNAFPSDDCTRKSIYASTVRGDFCYAWNFRYNEEMYSIVVMTSKQTPQLYLEFLKEMSQSIKRGKQYIDPEVLLTLVYDTICSWHFVDENEVMADFGNGPVVVSLTKPESRFGGYKPYELFPPEFDFIAVWKALLTCERIPDTASEIGAAAFGYNKKLKTFVVSATHECFDGIEYMTFMSAVFTGCNILSTVTFIGEKAFFDCKDITSIDIPEGVEYVGEYAWHYCNKVTKMTIRGDMKVLPSNVFSMCSSLVNLTLPDKLEVIGTHAFDGCSQLGCVSIPYSVTDIGDHAFADCVELKLTAIPESLKSIGASAFLRCLSLTNFTFSSSLTSIGDFASLVYVAFGGFSEHDTNSTSNSPVFDCSVTGEVHVPPQYRDWSFFGLPVVRDYIVPFTLTFTAFQRRHIQRDSASWFVSSRACLFYLLT